MCSCQESITKIEKILEEYLTNLRTLETREDKNTNIYAIVVAITVLVSVLMCAAAVAIYMRN
jgi:hypothetical protein